MLAHSVKVIATCTSSGSVAQQTSRSVLHSQPTILTGCYTSQNQVAIALGCEDGSVFTFISSASLAPPDSKQAPSIQVPSELQIAAARKNAPTSAPHPRATSPEPIYRPLSPSAFSMSALSNRGSSGTHTPNPLAVPSRSRITQPGISRASIEASKARVEVGDEQGKLRAMLAKGSMSGVPTKVRRVSLGSLESFEGKGSDRTERKLGMSLARSVVGVALGGVGAKASLASASAVALPPPSTNDESEDEAASVGSASISGSTLAAAAAVTGSLDIDSLEFRPRSHILPAHGGMGEAVTGLEVVGDQDLTLSLLSLADGYCLSSVHADDLPRLNPPHEYKGADSVAGSWEWITMSVVPYIESVIVMIAARPHPDSVSTRTTHSRVSMYKIPEFNIETVPDPSVSLEKVGEWLIGGDAKSIAFVTGCSGLMFAYINDKGHAVIVPLNMLPPPPEGEIEVSVKHEDLEPAPSIGMPIPNPFKAFKPREVAKTHVKTQRRDGRLLVGAEKDMGLCWDWSESDKEQEEIVGMRAYAQGLADSDALVAIWTPARLLVYGADSSQTKLERLSEVLADDLVNVFISSREEIVAIRQNRLDTYMIRKTDSNGDPTPFAKDASFYCEKTSTITFQSPVQLAVATLLLGQLCIMSTRISPDSDLAIGLQYVYQGEKGNEKAWHLRHNKSQELVEATAVLPVDIDSIFVTRSNGKLYRVPFEELLLDPGLEVTESVLEARATKLWFVTEEWTNTLFLLGALDNGGIACWDARTLKLVSQWTIFISELESVISLGLGDDRLGRLKGCVMAMAVDGTIAIIVLDGMNLLCVIPGSPAPLDRVCIGGDNLLLFYSHGLARLWDMKTHEFWRSMQQSKGEELLDQGGWFEVPVGRWEAPRPVHLLGALQNNISSPDAAATLVVDVSALAELTGKQPQAQEETSKMTRKQVAQILAALAPCGMDEEVDAACRDAFRAGRGDKVAWGLISERFGASSIVVSDDPAGAWKISPRYTAMRLLSVVALLRTTAAFEEYEKHVSGIIAFYVGCLSSTVGPEFQPPSLGVLASYWVSSPDEVRQAARSIFESRLAQMSEVEVVQCVEFWREHLPILQPSAAAHSPLAVRALIVCGVVAATKHSLLPPAYVTDIAKSIALYLYDEAQVSASAVNRILSIELCSRGFQVWQHHVDAMEVLRVLFRFAVGSSSGGKNMGGKEARAAVLQIAASSTPLFMTTLSLDITQAKSTEHRRATMQLVAFIVRKKPLVLYPNLPRLIEAVVKSLDPSSTTARDAIMDAATEILAEVVRIYPSVDFHTATQKLAVGTPEGAVVVYDLKTATRLYVLEGHSRRLTVLSFSPDGRRLATASLEESVVMVWKVGASFTSWFAPGAPPRQGHGHGEPFKRLDFNVGDEAHMTVAATLEWVTFAWPTERTARLSIRDSVLTFSC